MSEPASDAGARGEERAAEWPLLCAGESAAGRLEGGEEGESCFSSCTSSITTSSAQLPGMRNRDEAEVSRGVKCDVMSCVLVVLLAFVDIASGAGGGEEGR